MRLLKKCWSYPLKWSHNPRKGHHIPFGKLCFLTHGGSVPGLECDPHPCLWAPRITPQNKHVTNKAIRHGFTSGFKAGPSRISYSWKFILQRLCSVSRSRMAAMKACYAVHFTWTGAPSVIRVSGGLHTKSFWDHGEEQSETLHSGFIGRLYRCSGQRASYYPPATISLN